MKWHKQSGKQYQQNKIVLDQMEDSPHYLFTQKKTRNFLQKKTEIQITYEKKMNLIPKKQAEV